MWMFLGPKISDEFRKFLGKPLDESTFRRDATRAGFTRTKVRQFGKGHWVVNPYRLNALLDPKTKTVVGFRKG
jgi:hypothetical protein